MTQESPDTNTVVSHNEPPTTNARTLLGRVNTAIYTYNNFKHVYNQVRNWQSERKTRYAYSVAIDSNDRFYYDVQKWLLSQVDPEDQRSIRLMSYDYDGEGDKLYRLFDQAIDGQKVKIEGHEVTVNIERPLNGKELLQSELIGKNSVANIGNRGNIDSPRLVFWTYSSDANESVLRFFERLKEKGRNEKRRPRLHLLGTWYGSGSQEIPERDINSVVLATGQMERIIADIEEFLHSEKEYNRRGIPWHRGYIFYGPPGTGKSSLPKVLASHFGIDLYYYPIGSANSDLEITNVVSKVTPKSILLLEDIDVFKGFKERKDDDKGTGNNEFSASGLLNILDGVMTPHGMITIMTTNHRQVLDPAIFRPGRVDLDEYIGPMEPGQADKLFTFFYKQIPSRPLGVSNIVPAAIMEIMKRNMKNPQRAEEEIRGLIGKGSSLREAEADPAQDDRGRDRRCGGRRMARQLDEQLIRQKVEKFVAWLSLIFTLIGVAEKANHYRTLAKQKKQKQKHPLGFRP